MNNKYFKLSLAVGFALSLIICCVQAASQNEMSAKIVRLHILANSDTGEDQALKLKVRDEILTLDLNKTPNDALLLMVEQAAKECLSANGSEYDVKVSYERMFFETRHYDGFSLPAGYYNAVRVIIGEGAGQNWWCVVYPSLCNGLAEGEEVLTEDELSYIQKSETKYVIRFKLQEVISAWSEDFF